MSSYELWLSLLDKGQYPDWKGGRGEVDFMIFLSGKDGKNGMTAYEEWKRMIATNTVEDPHGSGTVWHPSRNTERDFFWFLTGAKGDKGDKGDTGAKGEKGETGAKGDKEKRERWETKENPETMVTRGDRVCRELRVIKETPDLMPMPFG